MAAGVCFGPSPPRRRGILGPQRPDPDRPGPPHPGPPGLGHRGLPLRPQAVHGRGQSPGACRPGPAALPCGPACVWRSAACPPASAGRRPRPPSSARPCVDIWPTRSIHCPQRRNSYVFNPFLRSKRDAFVQRPIQCRPIYPPVSRHSIECFPVIRKEGLADLRSTCVEHKQRAAQIGTGIGKPHQNSGSCMRDTGASDRVQIWGFP